jgi:predicted alpha/beta-hydrolase family hydrolase
MLVHGTRDGFGSIDGLVAALKLIRARTELVPIAGAGHELMLKRNRDEVPKIVEAFRSFAHHVVARSHLLVGSMSDVAPGQRGTCAVLETA